MAHQIGLLSPAACLVLIHCFLNENLSINPALDIAALALRIGDFQNTVNARKAEAAPSEFPWYPYDSLANFTLLNNMLTAENRNLGQLAGGLPVLDVGSADGATAFLLEQTGLDVDVIDNPPTNFNGMRGLHLLKNAFRSKVNIYSADLDTHFALPRSNYGLVLFLGLLYHLKNPFYALETLSHHARYCLLSTRVAKFDPSRRRLLEDLPLAYLVAPQETNNDATNFWIFSRTGLDRILYRTGWEVCDRLYVGNTENSDPASPEGDERAFCLIRSSRVRPAAITGCKLLSGWFELESGCWRWTADRFSVQVPPRSNASQNQNLVIRFTLPEVSFRGGRGKYVLNVSVDGRLLGSETYTKAGEKTMRLPFAATPSREEPWTVDCQLDPPQLPAPGDSRTLGVLVRFFDESGQVLPAPFQVI